MSGFRFSVHTPTRSCTCRFPEIRSGLDFASSAKIITSSGVMITILHVLGLFVRDLFKSRRWLQAENLFLRHQLNIALRRLSPRPRLRWSDRAMLGWITRICSGLLELAQVVKPETILRWHRGGFKAYWRWKSRKRAGRPKIDRDLRDLIQRMSRENPLWGAPRIHGELLMLGFEVAQSTVSKYMSRAVKTAIADAGRPFCATTPRRLPQSICAWFRRRPSSACSPFWFWAMAAGSCCGSR